MDLNTVHVYSLLRDELIYEVTIRGETPEDTVHKLRKQLKNLVRDFKSEEILGDDDAFPAKEFPVIKEKLKDLKKRIEDFEMSGERSLLIRAKALFCHLFFRIERANVETEADATIKTKLKDSLRNLLQRLDPHVAKPTMELSSNESVEPQVLSNPSTCTNNNFKVSKWNLKFDGIGRGEAASREVDPEDWKYWQSLVVKYFKTYNVAPVLFEPHSSDVRPYLNVKLLDLTICGLLDSGAAVSIIGNGAHARLRNAGYHMETSNSNKVNVADGSECDTLGFMTLPITFNNVTKIIKFYVIPSIVSNIILGVDFWKAFNLMPEIFKNIAFITTPPDFFTNSPVASVQSLQDLHKFRSTEDDYYSVFQLEGMLNLTTVE
ncbi:hypothetical protein ACJJTC_010654 [Scirpophaga incertulas]